MSWFFGNDGHGNDGDDPFKILDDIFKQMDQGMPGFTGNPYPNQGNQPPIAPGIRNARSHFLIDPRHKSERAADEHLPRSRKIADFDSGSTPSHAQSRHLSVFDQLLNNQRQPRNQYPSNDGLSQESFRTSWSSSDGNSVKREEKVVGGNTFVTITSTDKDGNVNIQKFES